MPVRRIPKNHLFVTGRFASSKSSEAIEFESMLEKDFMLLLDFDDSVSHFESQPVNIPVSGVARGYTPDILVHYVTDPTAGQTRKPLLTEIKHSGELHRNAEKYATKFNAAQAYATEAGWEFRVTTEKDIRIPRLANIKFLRQYRNLDPGANDHDRLLACIEKSAGPLSVSELLSGIASSDQDRLHWLPVIWHAALTGVVDADMDRPLTPASVLSLSGSSQ